VIAFAVAGLTAFYMFRLLLLTFHGKPSDSKRIEGIKESPFVMTVPLIVLATVSLFVFYSFNPFGAADGWFFAAIERPLSIVPELLQPASNALFHDVLHDVHGTAMTLSILIAAAGILLAFAVYQWKKISADNLAKRAGVLYRGASGLWYFDEIYDRVFVKGLFLLTKISQWVDTYIIDAFVNGTAVVARGISTVSGWIDNNIVDGLVNATASTADRAGGLLSHVQTGRLQTYLVYIVFSFLVLFILFL
jgi:NADH-quinone oxidoreductase subunit L